MEKKKRQKEKKKIKIEETLMKAQKMIGIGPFTRKELDDHCETEEDFEKVKLNMIEEHLRNNYKYNNREIKDLRNTGDENNN